MAGKPETRQWQLATNRQLWRLNQLGRLQLVDDGVSISADEAKVLIEPELGGLGMDRFPDTKWTVRWANRSVRS